MEYVLQQVWLAVGLMAAFIVGAVYWRRQHALVSTARDNSPPPTPVVYRDSPTVRVVDSQRVDRRRKVVRLKVGESVDLLATAAGLPPRFRITAKGIVDGSDLEAAQVAVEFGGVQLSCGPLVDETANNEFVLPRASREEHRSSVFYYQEHADSLEFMRIKLRSADVRAGLVELDIMQMDGHWPSRMS